MIEKQTELVKDIVLKHQSEMAQAKRTYELAHPPDSQATAPDQSTPK